MSVKNEFTFPELELLSFLLGCEILRYTRTVELFENNTNLYKQNLEILENTKVVFHKVTSMLKEYVKNDE